MERFDDRVAITGIGVVSSLGSGIEAVWQRVLAGESGIRVLEESERQHPSVALGAPVVDFDINDLIPDRESKRIDSSVHYALGAAVAAREDAGIAAVENCSNIGVSVGTAVLGMEQIEQARTLLDAGKQRQISPFLLSGTIPNSSSGYISMHLGYNGPSISVCHACSTGAANLISGAQMLQTGMADIVLAGGTDMLMTPVMVNSFVAMKALALGDDTSICRPWDEFRQGFVLGAGACIMVLEPMKAALQRNARIYAALSGGGLASDAHHMVHPHNEGRGIGLAMERTLASAGLAPEQIGYINAHSASTPVGDLSESKAIEAVFGAHSKQLAVSSSKPNFGHTMGAAGCLEAAITVHALRDQILPPTLNLNTPGDGCHLDYVPRKPRRKRFEHALKTSVGLGGTNAALALSRVSEGF